MDIRHKLHVKQASLPLCLLALILLLAACGSNGGTNPPPTPTPTPTPTGKTYNGDGYQLTYPQNWDVKTDGTIIEFTPSNGDPTLAFLVTVTPATPGVDLDAALNGGLNGLKGDLQNYKQDNTVPSTTSIGGDSWKGAGATGDKDGYHLKSVVLVDQHPASTGKVFVISLTAKADSYNNVYNTVYKPILDSYKFT